MKTLISFKEALHLTLSNVHAGRTEVLPLNQLISKILSEDIVSKVDCPSTSSSRKDGYAVISEDLTEASVKNPAKLRN
jgi:molybdopterin molybdotransferase